MYLEKLALWNFKNYDEESLNFSERVNVFVGKNGSGKTNLLDAIYFLTLTKSAFSANDSSCVRRAQSGLFLNGSFSKQGRHFDLAVSVQSGSRKIFKENGIEYDKISEHIGKYPVVLIAPDDTDIVKDSSDLRRRFFDGIISQLDRLYLENLIRYNHGLKNRNALLKIFFESGKPDFLALESYDHVLINAGKYLYKKRSEFLHEFLPVFQDFYSFIVDQEERTSISYFSTLHEMEYEDGLKKNRQKDLVLQRTNFGIHKDDFDFRIGDGELKKLGSQGQQKSFLIALKLAQLATIKKHKGFSPILLLDDIFDKLDDFRISKLMDLIKREDSQLFITDARPHRTTELLKQIDIPCKLFNIDDGHVNKEQYETMEGL